MLLLWPLRPLTRPRDAGVPPARKWTHAWRPNPPYPTAIPPSGPMSAPPPAAASPSSRMPPRSATPCPPDPAAQLSPVRQRTGTHATLAGSSRLTLSAGTVGGAALGGADGVNGSVGRGAFILAGDSRLDLDGVTLNVNPEVREAKLNVTVSSVYSLGGQNASLVFRRLEA